MHQHNFSFGQWLFRPGAIWLRILDRFVYPALLKSTPGVTLGGRVILRGQPLIDTDIHSRIHLGDSIVLNSRNPRYHGNLYGVVKLYAEAGSKITIGANTRIHGTCIHARESISIGSNCLIAGNTQIFDSNGHDLSFDNIAQRLNTRGTTKPILISDNVWIGLNSIILPGVTIGEGTVVGAGSVVTRSLPPMVIAAGNPARVIGDNKGGTNQLPQVITPFKHHDAS